MIPMSEQGDGPAPGGRSFDKATVDRWQVFGGAASVVALLLSVVSGIRNLVPLSLLAAGVVTVLGIGLLYRWGRRPQRHVTRHFVLPVLITVVGAATAGVLGGLELRPAAGSAEPGADPSTTTAGPTTGSTTEPATDPTTTTKAVAATTTTTSGVARPAGGEPSVHRSGPVTISADFAIDLDSTGENGGVTDDISEKVDFRYDKILGIRADHFLLLPGTPSYQECVSGTGRIAEASQSDVDPGESFCVKTSEGRWARLAVVESDRAALKFDVVVWNKP